MCSAGDASAELIFHAGEVVGAQPQPQQMAALDEVVVIVVGLTGVQDAALLSSCTSPGWKSIVTWTAGSLAMVSINASASCCAWVSPGTCGWRWASRMYQPM
jgi:hypothetical protein